MARRAGIVRPAHLRAPGQWAGSKSDLHDGAMIGRPLDFRLQPALRHEDVKAVPFGSKRDGPGRSEGMGGYHDAMSKLLLNLRNIPDDEAGDVRAMLDAKRIAFYETRPSIWGISAGGIWVVDDADFADAKRMFDEYEQERSARIRAEYAAARHAGTAETFVGVLRKEPLRVAMTLLGILFVLGVVALPFILL